MIISFSGLDGAGKTTQIKMLLSYYQKRGAKTGSIYDLMPDIRYRSVEELKRAYIFLRECDVIHMRFRLNSNQNAAIMQKLEQTSCPQISYAVAAAIQGYCDHLSLYQNVLRSLNEDGKTILFDRHFYDELAFKQIYGCPRFILNMLYGKAKGADIPFYVRIPPQVCYARNRARLDETAMIYQNIERISALANLFDGVALQMKMVILNGTDNPEKISKQIISILERLAETT